MDRNLSDSEMIVAELAIADLSCATDCSSGAADLRRELRCCREETQVALASAMSASREAVGSRAEGGTVETAVDEGEREGGTASAWMRGASSEADGRVERRVFIKKIM